jgi:hypothetical protein
MNITFKPKDQESTSTIEMYRDAVDKYFEFTYKTS